MRKRRRRRSRSRRKLKRPLLVSGFGLLLLVGLFLTYFLVILRPPLTDRKEIYKGVYLTVKQIPGQFGSGKIMIAEVHWDVPGVELYFSPFYPQSTGRPQYTLLPGDYLRMEADLDVMINTTRYVPAEWWRSFPFKKVDSLETLVWENRVSHMHALSYMFGWDHAGDFLYDQSKPPKAEFLEKLRWGIGVQSVSISDGQLRLGAMEKRREAYARTFIGVDPVEKVLWLMVAEKITEMGMNSMASDLGVIVGGQLDCQDASTMIIGSNAQGVRALTGIRGRRMLAATMGVRAEPIQED